MVARTKGFGALETIAYPATAARQLWQTFLDEDRCGKGSNRIKLGLLAPWALRRDGATCQSRRHELSPEAISWWASTDSSTQKTLEDPEQPPRHRRKYGIR
jgi:hypothetical protein